MSCYLSWRCCHDVSPYKGLEKPSETLLPTNLSLPCHLRLITAIFVSCDLSFGSDFLRQRYTSVPFFQSAFQIKTDVKIHAVAAAQCWGSNMGLVCTRKVFYHDSSEAPLGANGVRGALRNCPPSRPQLSLSSANLSSQLTRATPTMAQAFAAGVATQQGLLCPCLRHLLFCICRPWASTPVLWYKEQCPEEAGRLGLPNSSLLPGIRLTTAAVGSLSLCKGNRGGLDWPQVHLTIFIFKSFVS